MKELIFIGGILWVATKWMKRASVLLKQNGLVYGDNVTFIKKDGVGREHVLTGKLINKGGVPMVLLDSPHNGANIVPWEPHFGKSK